MVAGDGGRNPNPEPNKTMGWGSPAKQSCFGGTPESRALEGEGLANAVSDSPENA